MTCWPGENVWMPDTDDFVHATCGDDVSTCTVVKTVDTFRNGHAAYLPDKQRIRIGNVTTQLCIEKELSFVEQGF